MPLDGDAECTETNLGPCKTSLMEYYFAKMVSGF